MQELLMSNILMYDKILDLEGVAISNPYMYISDMETYIDVYCNDIKETMTLKINDVERVD